jgi:hypothetical protein
MTKDPIYSYMDFDFLTIVFDYEVKNFFYKPEGFNEFCTLFIELSKFE